MVNARDIAGKAEEEEKENTVTYAKISPTMVNARDIAGNAEEEEKEVLVIMIDSDLS